MNQTSRAGDLELFRRIDRVRRALAARRPGARNAHGFSLVEVALALGIVCVGLMAMVGLMPVGMKAIRDAMTTSSETQIVQDVSSRLEVMPFSKLADYVGTGKELYFDDEASPQTARDLSTRFIVTMELADPAFPSSDSAKDLRSSLVNVRIKVSPAKGLMTPGAPGSRFVLQLANSGS